MSEDAASYKQMNPSQVGGDHYSRMKIQPIEYIMANDIPFVEGSIIKYVSSWRAKGGIQDLEKARSLLDMLIDDLNAEEKAELKEITTDDIGVFSLSDDGFEITVCKRYVHLDLNSYAGEYVQEFLHELTEALHQASDIYDELRVTNGP